MHAFNAQVPPLILPEGRDARSPRLARLGSMLGSPSSSSPIEVAQSPDLSSHGSPGLSRKASLGPLTRTGSMRVTLHDVPALLFAALLRKLHEQQRGRPLEASDATILQEVLEEMADVASSHFLLEPCGICCCYWCCC